MNLTPTIWQAFWLAQPGFVPDTQTAQLEWFIPNTRPWFCPLPQWGVLTISGADATPFLQGQVTCDVHAVTAHQSGLGALCTAQGRALATFLLVKCGDDYRLILPQALLSAVHQRLSMFVLRAKVTLTPDTGTRCLFGTSPGLPPNGWLAAQLIDEVQVIAWAGRMLCCAPAEAATAFCANLAAQGYQANPELAWQLADLLAGIPWLDAATSGEFVPQMFNLDRLGGISFNKGCYTGQEIIARTHYLGKSKRGLSLVAGTLPAPAAKTLVLDAAGAPVGHVLSAIATTDGCRALLVKQHDAETLTLPDGRPLTMLPLPELPLHY